MMASVLKWATGQKLFMSKYVPKMKQKTDHDHLENRSWTHVVPLPKGSFKLSLVAQKHAMAKKQDLSLPIEMAARDFFNSVKSWTTTDWNISALILCVSFIIKPVLTLKGKANWQEWIFFSKFLISWSFFGKSSSILDCRLLSVGHGLSIDFQWLLHLIRSSFSYQYMFIWAVKGSWAYVVSLI